MSVEPDQVGPVPHTAPFDPTEWAIPHPDPFVCDIRIGASQLSRAIAHVSNIEYIRWVDRIAELHADQLGFTQARMLERGIMWFVVRHEIDYLAEVWPDDELVAATWVRSVQRVKSWRDTVIVRPADKMQVCRAATLWVLVDLGTRRPTRIEPRMVSRFSPLEPAGQRCTSR